MHLPTHAACESLTDTVIENTLRVPGTRARRYADGSRIWHTTDLPNRIFRLGSGRVHVVGVSDDGRERLYQVVKPGEMFGEIASARIGWSLMAPKRGALGGARSGR